MRGRMLRSAVGHCLLVGLCWGPAIHAGQDPPGQDSQPVDPESQDADRLGTVFAEGLILPQFDPDAVWLDPTPNPDDPRARVTLVSASFDLGHLFENFDIQNGPVRGGMPTPLDMRSVTTPVEHSTPALAEFDVIGWTWKSR